MGLQKNNRKTTRAAKIIIGTRGSELALWQARHVGELLKSRFPDIDVEIKKVKTTGDKILDSPLSKIGDKGLFTKELDIALLEKEIDIAVHSLKDIPTEISEELIISAVLRREDVRDIFIPNPRSPHRKMKDIPVGGEVATGSLRRRCQLLHLRPDLTIKEIRGNLNTRINKLTESSWTGMILAYAGVSRLGMKDVIGEIIPVSVILPAVGQGAIGILSRRNDPSILSIVNSLDHEPTHIATFAERALLRHLEGGCQIPIGAYAAMTGNHLSVQAIVGDLKGEELIRDSVSGASDDYENLGIQLAEKLIEKGAGKILDEIRNQGKN